MSHTACKECSEGAVLVAAPIATMPEFSSTRATLAAKAAADLYDQGHFCGEAVLRVVNSLAPEPLPASVVRLGSGFCEGVGGAGCTCGALAGGVMAIGLLSGRDSETDAWEPSYYPSGEFHERFRSAFNAGCCRTIVRPFGGMEGPGRHEHCSMVTGTAAGWIVEIAEQRGWL